MQLVTSLLFLLILATLPLSANDGEDNSENERYSENVVVTADRFEEPLENSGSTVSIITREEIEEQKSPFVLDLLRSVPGLYIAQGGSPGKITSLFTRGAGSDQTLVTIDGIQINDSTGFIDLANLATTNIERIEIVRAPQSTLYGSDALGGVINILTRGAGPLFSARGEFGSDATWNGNARAAVGSDVNRLAFEYSRFVTDGETSNDDFDNKTIAANGKFQVTDWTQAGIVYRHVDSDLGIPFLSGVATPDQRQTSESNLLHIPVKQKITEQWDAAFHLSIFDQELHFRHPTNPFGLTFSDTDSRTTTYHFLNTISVQEHTIIAGFEHEKIAISDESSFGVSLDDAEVTNNAFYAQMQLAAWDPLIVTLGIRVDDHSEFGSDTNPRVAISYRPLQRLRIHGSLGTAFRAPRPFELSGPFGNAALIPEEVTGWDAGVDYDAMPDVLTLSATVFQNQFSDLIGFNLDTFTFANFNEVETSGLELQVAAYPAPHVRIGGSYTYLRTEDKTTGEELLRRPNNTGSIYVTYSENRVGVHFNWSLIGERLDVNDITFATVNNPGYNRADLVVSYHLAEKIQPYIRVTNLFNQKYQEIFGFPSPDRGVFAGFNFSL